MENNRNTEVPKYQVALSFAGEQRDYVESVAQHLAARRISLFYDGFEIVDLWGRNLTKAFYNVFAQQTACVVMFISSDYIKKLWPSYERKLIIERMAKEPYVLLPVRFDNTQVDGLPSDISYLNAKDHTPAELSAKIAKKLGLKRFDGKASQVPPPTMASPVGELVFDYSSYDGRYIIGTGEWWFETQWTKASDKSIHVYNDPPSINGIALAPEYSSISQVSNADTLDYTSRCRAPKQGQIVVMRNTEGFYSAIQLLKIKDNSRDDDVDELRFRYAIQTDGSDNFSKFSGM